MHATPNPPPAPRKDRLALIADARSAVLQDGALTPTAAVAPWIERSWRRCLASGHRPEHRLAFDTVSAPELRRTAESNRELVAAARPVLDTLGRAIANTRYFAILTNARGVVVDVDGPVDRSDRRAHLITRIGADLSESAVGTTAIGAALIEQQPVWLHRGEHFFADTSMYSCAGAPLFGPDGACVGMLDLTGIEAIERPELRHLVAQSARSIENALTLRQPHSLMVRLNWPGRALGDDTDGLVCLDADGWVTGANSGARQMVPQLGASAGERVHGSEVFAMPFEALFDASRKSGESMELPLWSGLRLQALPRRSGGAAAGALALRPVPLKDVEIAMIRKAVADARGNVQQAARALGISRATVYRKLGRRPLAP
jgi:transcriptional regulator of acetoin/glycerol metabolism